MRRAGGLIVLMDTERLTEFERELLEACGEPGEPTTLLCDMLEQPRDRKTVEAALRDLVSRGLLTTERGPYYDQVVRTGSSGETEDAEYVAIEDDWWDLTTAGRLAIGLPAHRRPPSYSPPMRRFPTAEEAAVEDLPEGVARVLDVAYSPDEMDAVVLLALDEPAGPWLCTTVCWRDRLKGWGWSGLRLDEPTWAPAGKDGKHVAMAWGQAPAGTRAAILEFNGVEYKMPVKNGYYLLAVWNLPAWEHPDDEPNWDDPNSTPTLRRFV
jgi:hypothetical protein